MAKKQDDAGAWGFTGQRPTDQPHYREMVRNTKLRTLSDMSEREIRALEQHYGCPIVRPRRRQRQATA